MTATRHPQPTTVSRASLRSWLETRDPAPPADLASKLAECAESAPDAVFAGASLAEVLGGLGTWLLRPVVAGRKPAYDTALDLLAADAFVTYAFEAAAEEGGDVTGLATELLTKARA
jgi:hypothetical protein